MNCPCKDCICVPVCKLKDWTSLLSECDIINQYIPVPNPNRLHDRYIPETLWQARTRILCETLKPRYWKLSGNPGVAFVETIRMEELDHGRSRSW